MKRLRKDENRAAREYQDASRIAYAKRDKMIMQSIKKDEQGHSGRLGRILRRMKA